MRHLVVDQHEVEDALACASQCLDGIEESRGLDQAFGRQDRLEIDCSSVDKADVTSIQLLLSTAKTGEAQGRPVVLTSFSQSLRNTLRRAGFASDAIIDQHFPQKKDGV